MRSVEEGKASPAAGSLSSQRCFSRDGDYGDRDDDDVNDDDVDDGDNGKWR